MVESVAKTRLYEFQSPQWGSNSKNSISLKAHTGLKCFSPLSGEVILKLIGSDRATVREFQSPQWGSNSK